MDDDDVSPSAKSIFGSAKFESEPLPTSQLLPFLKIHPTIFGTYSTSSRPAQTSKSSIALSEDLLLFKVKNWSRRRKNPSRKAHLPKRSDQHSHQDIHHPRHHVLQSIPFTIRFQLNSRTGIGHGRIEWDWKSHCPKDRHLSLYCLCPRRFPQCTIRSCGKQVGSSRSRHWYRRRTSNHSTKGSRVDIY